MQTAVLGFGESLPHLLCPEIQETGRTPADLGRPKLGAAMLQECGWSSYAQSYSELPIGWHEKAPDWKASAVTRFEGLLGLVARRPERSIAVVAHHDFFRASLTISFAFCEVTPHLPAPSSLARTAGSKRARLAPQAQGISHAAPSRTGPTLHAAGRAADHFSRLAGRPRSAVRTPCKLHRLLRLPQHQTYGRAAPDEGAARSAEEAGSAARGEHAGKRRRRTRRPPGCSRLPVGAADLLRPNMTCDVSL